MTFTVDGVEFDVNGTGLKGVGDGLDGRLRISGIDAMRASGKGVESDALVFDVETSVDGVADLTELEVGLDADYVEALRAEDFPVVIDPSVQFTLSQTWTHKYERRTTNASYCYEILDSGNIRFGNKGAVGSACVYRGVLNMNYSSYSGANVADVELKLDCCLDQSPQSGTENVWVWWAATDEFRDNCRLRGSVGGPGEVGGVAASVEEDHGDEGFGVVEPAGVGAQAADAGVDGLGEAIGQSPLDGVADRGPVVADAAGEFHERGELRSGGVVQPVIQRPTGRGERQSEQLPKFFFQLPSSEHAPVRPGKLTQH